MDKDQPKQIIIDTDPGVDDVMAIFFALLSPEVDVVGLTTVFGNATTEITTENALRLVEVADRPDIVVARGAERSLMKPFLNDGTHGHGKNGLGEADFPAPKGQPDQRRAAQYIVDTIMANPGQITLVPLGPLTNIALAVSLEPRIAEHVREVVLMGGSVNARGNASRVAEANVHNDPDAASIVFNAPWPVTMVGLDVTRKTVMTADYIATLTAADNRYTEFIGKIVPHYMGFSGSFYGSGKGFPVHDSSAVAYVIDSTLFDTKPLHVDVETTSQGNRGLTAADWRGRGGLEPNVNVCVDVDSERFLQLYHDHLTNG